MKKLIAVLLTCVLLFSCVSAAVCADSACTCGYTPVVYVKGRFNIYKDVTADELVMAERNTSGDDAIEEAAKNIVSKLVKAIFTNDYTEYADCIYDEVIEMYDGYALNNDGEIDNNSGIEPKYCFENLMKDARKNGRNFHKKYHNSITMYDFHYDCRIDPCETAEQLHAYIELVKEVTGHDKIILVTRCMGGVITNAYLNMYGYDSVEKLFIFNSIACGAEIADSAFTGKFTLDGAAITRFLYEILGSSVVLDLVKATLAVGVSNGSINIAVNSIDRIYNRVLPLVVPRLIRDIFGRCPGWYGMVSADRFEEAKAFLLSDNEDGKYDKLIQKIDNYNYKYKGNVIAILNEAAEHGVLIYMMAKYNDQLYPCVENYNALGDNVISTYKQTYCGATTAPITKTLDKEYLAAADPAYISPDKMIDASTVPFPAHTWFIRDLQHDEYPGCTSDMIMDIVRSSGYADIYTFAEYPQYLIYSDEKEGGCLFPITEENADTTGAWPDTTLFGALRNFFVKLFAALKALFAQLKAKND